MKIINITACRYCQYLHAINNSTYWCAYDSHEISKNTNLYTEIDSGCLLPDDPLTGATIRLADKDGEK